MNKNIIIVVVGGFVIALLVAIVVSSGLKKDTIQKVEKVETATILVASKVIFAGEEITKENVKWMEWPLSNMVKGSIKRAKDMKLKDIVGERVKTRIEKGLPILKNQLVDGEDSSMLSATLSPGMRAVAIDVKAWSMAGGFILPGDRVDVVLTYQVRMSGMRDNPEIQGTINKYASETILENVKVLAIDQRTKKGKKKEEAAKVGKTVTLEVDARGAEKLFLARSMGDLSLSLRGVGDTTVKEKKQFTTDVSVSDVMKEITRIQEDTDGVRNVIRVYNGENVRTVPVKGNVDKD